MPRSVPYNTETGDAYVALVNETASLVVVR